jgi:hypothetical protein
MFLMVGPNTGLGHNSPVLMIESQARYIVDSLRRLRRRGAECIVVRPEVQDSFNDWLDSRMAGTAWQAGGCHSWYQDPRSGRNTVLWPDDRFLAPHPAGPDVRLPGVDAAMIPFRPAAAVAVVTAAVGGGR